MPALDTLLARDPSQPPRRLCVVTCCDSEASSWLGQQPGAAQPAVVLAVPGPAVRPGSDELARSVAAAVLLHGCDEVVVLAHTGCSLVTTQASEVVSRLAPRGFDRARLPEDVRTFFNLQASPRQIAVETAAAIRSAPFMPAGLPVHAALLDGGELSLLEHGENAAGAAPRPPSSGLFGDTGPTAFASSLPEGIGVGLAESEPVQPGPVSLDYSLPPAPELGLQPLVLQTTELSSSAIDLRPSAIGFEAKPLDLRLTELAASSTLELHPSGIDVRPSAPPPLPTMPGGAVQAPARPAATARPAEVPPRRQPGARPPPRKQPAPAPARLAAPPRPAATPPRQVSGSVRLPAELLPKIEKVRDFFRAEIDSSVRVEVSRALRESYTSGDQNPEMIKAAFRPVLESGPKRYKVIDELLAIKETATALDRDGCYAALRQLVE